MVIVTKVVTSRETSPYFELLKTFSLPQIEHLSPHASTTANFVIPLHYCIRPVRLKFELINQESAEGKNCTVLTSNAVSIHESKGIYNSTNHIRLKNPH